MNDVRFRPKADIEILTSSLNTKNPNSMKPEYELPRWPSMVVLSLVVVVLSVSLHELMHLIVGRFMGLPAHYVSLTAVAVTPEAAAIAPAAALALMNGVAPVVTMGLGVLAFVSVPVFRPRVSALITSFVAWWAIFGVAYIGAQLMTVGYPADLRGTGADLAAVVGGYWQASDRMRAVIALIGLSVFMFSGLWLGTPLAVVSRLRKPAWRIAERWGQIAVWRWVSGVILGLLTLGLAALGFSLLLRGAGEGVSLMYVAGSFVWPAFMALLTPWSTAWANNILKHWIAPGALASAAFLLLGLATHSDYATVGMVLLPPLVTAAYGGLIGRSKPVLPS